MPEQNNIPEVRKRKGNETTPVSDNEKKYPIITLLNAVKIPGILTSCR